MLWVCEVWWFLPLCNSSPVVLGNQGYQGRYEQQKRQRLRNSKILSKFGWTVVDWWKGSKLQLLSFKSVEGYGCLQQNLMGPWISYFQCSWLVAYDRLLKEQWCRQEEVGLTAALFFILHLLTCAQNRRIVSWARWLWWGVCGYIFLGVGIVAWKRMDAKVDGSSGTRNRWWSCGRTDLGPVVVAWLAKWPALILATSLSLGFRI